jgi:hypothetical protein
MQWVLNSDPASASATAFLTGHTKRITQQINVTANIMLLISLSGPKWYCQQSLAQQESYQELQSKAILAGRTLSVTIYRFHGLG